VILESTATVLQIITDIVVILLFLGLVILVINMIKYLKILAEKIEGISDSLVDLKPKVETSLEKMNNLSDNLSSVFVNVNEQVDRVGFVVNKFTDTANDVLDLTNSLQQKVHAPLIEGAGTISAISSGVKTFLDVWNSGKQRRIARKRDRKVEELTDSIEEFNKELEEVNSQLSDLQSKD
jgi:uncharacterized protein YoxC